MVSIEGLDGNRAVRDGGQVTHQRFNAGSITEEPAIVGPINMAREIVSEGRLSGEYRGWLRASVCT